MLTEILSVAFFSFFAWFCLWFFYILPLLGIIFIELLNINV